MNAENYNEILVELRERRVKLLQSFEESKKGLAQAHNMVKAREEQLHYLSGLCAHADEVLTLLEQKTNVEAVPHYDDSTKPGNESQAQ